MCNCFYIVSTALFPGEGYQFLTYIILGQEMERTENFVVLKFEALCSLEVPQICAVLGILRYRLRAALRLELLLALSILRRRDARASAGSTMVVVGVGGMRADCLRRGMEAVVEV